MHSTLRTPVVNFGKSVSLEETRIKGKLKKKNVFDSLFVNVLSLNQLYFPLESLRQRFQGQFGCHVCDSSPGGCSPAGQHTLPESPGFCELYLSPWLCRSLLLASLPPSCMDKPIQLMARVPFLRKFRLSHTLPPANHQQALGDVCGPSQTSWEDVRG